MDLRLQVRLAFALCKPDGAGSHLQPAAHTSVHRCTYCSFSSPHCANDQCQIAPLIPLILCSGVRLAHSPIKYCRGAARTENGVGARQEQFAWGSIVLMEPLTWDCFGNWGQGWEQGSGCAGISEQSHFFLSFFFFEVCGGLDSPSRRQPFICVLYDRRQKTALHTELNRYCFCKRCDIQFIYLRINGWEGLCVVLHLSGASEHECRSSYWCDDN